MKPKESTSPITPAPASAPPATVKIRFLQNTACETVEGQIINTKEGDVLEVPERAGRYLVDLGKAEIA